MQSLGKQLKTILNVSEMSIDPYKAGLIKANPYREKREITGNLVAILDLILEARGMQLIDPMSRALAKHSICEIAITDEITAEPGNIVNHVGYLGFFEVTTGGVAIAGDKFFINKTRIGQLVGFDVAHAPNHLNVVIKVDEVTTGEKMQLKIGDQVKITANP